MKKLLLSVFAAVLLLAAAPTHAFAQDQLEQDPGNTANGVDPIAVEAAIIACQLQAGSCAKVSGTCFIMTQPCSQMIPVNYTLEAVYLFLLNWAPMLMDVGYFYW